MLKSLRVPERLYQIAMWAITLVFASFLSGLGAQLVADLPGVDTSVTLDDFVDRAAADALTAERERLEARQRTLMPTRDSAQLVATSAGNAWSSAKSAFDAWIATRTATTDPAQDPEVLRRTREVEALKGSERVAQEAVERLDAELLSVRQSLDDAGRRDQALRDGARPAFTKAQFATELRVFGIRLALTLPLLVVAWWLVRRKRQSPWWPLLRGVVLFAVTAFFVELVPYLPSYGGYVRSVVGVVACILLGRWGISWMQAYVARREAAERQSEATRRQALKGDDAIKKMTLNLCPGCERPIAAGAASGSPAPANFCVHCGLTLFNQCGACGTRKNAFFTYCPACGTSAGAAPPTAASPSLAPTPTPAAG
jgi:hypothetical protein